MSRGPSPARVRPRPGRRRAPGDVCSSGGDGDRILRVLLVAAILPAMAALAGCRATDPALIASPPTAAASRGTSLPPDLRAVAEVTAGRLDRADAAWWGFDPADATAALQAAIDSGAPVVVVPAAPSPWVVGPLRLRSNLELVLEEGAVIEARAGAFLGRAENLLKGDGVENVTIRGYGATLRMRKADYTGPPYEKSQWRHAISLVSARRVRILGLRIESSGGDGIYLGSSRDRTLPPYCEDVHIKDVTLLDHHRQGISVISARRLLIEDTIMANTRGTAPRAGIDFEPNQPHEELTDCVLRRCTLVDNAGAGLQVFLRKLDETSLPVSISVEDCVIRGNLLQVWVTPAGGAPSGTVRIVGGDVGRPRLIRATKTLAVELVE